MRATQLLMEEHQIILKALRVLEAVAARGGPPPQALLDFFTEFADRHHHYKEEEILFPALEEAGFPRDAGPVGVMLHEHEQGRALTAALRDPAQFVQAAREYAALLSGHIAKENEVLFPMADRAVEDQRAVEDAFDAFERESVAQRLRHESAIAKLAKELL
ncbi:MAG: hemerythrin domain-containing protein [Myxococcales bacterium]